MEQISKGRIWLSFAFAVICVLVVQLPLIFNPGYLSHDEFQWAYLAQRTGGGFFGNGLWQDVFSFQYRPLTFSLWMMLSKHLFDHPEAFHAVLVLMGACNAGLLAVLLRGCGLPLQTALAGALVFALGPYAMHTHGWIGCIADLIWVGCTLAIGIVSQRERLAWAATAASVLTAVALMAKESAIVIPALLVLAWWFSARRKAWGVAAIASAVPVLIYLALRIKAILFAPAAAGSIYHWSFLSIPVRWTEYQLFPLMRDRLGAGDFLGQGLHGRHIWFAVVGWLFLAVALHRTGWRWLLAFVVGGAAALGPVLILAEAANQYGYGFAAVTAGVCALAWPHMKRAPRIVVTIVGVLCIWHGVVVMRSIHDIGEKQSRFSPAMAAAVASTQQYPVRLRPQVEKDRWIYTRLTFDIPEYRGVPIGQRIVLADPGALSDYVILSDGSLQPVAH